MTPLAQVQTLLFVGRRGVGKTTLIARRCTGKRVLDAARVTLASLAERS